jgi:hypothetical protein
LSPATDGARCKTLSAIGRSNVGTSAVKDNAGMFC